MMYLARPKSYLYPAAVSNDPSFLETPCDILVPAAVAGTITGPVAEKVQVGGCVGIYSARNVKVEALDAPAVYLPSMARLPFAHLAV